MNTEQILKLIDAGYTKADIEQMTMPEENTPAVVPVTQEPEKEVEEKTEQVLDVKTEKRLEKIEEILSQIAANGIANSKAPEMPEKRNVVAEVLEHL